MLEVGTKVKNFELPDQRGVNHKLSDYANKRVVIYFYPKDDTEGCTIQANAFKEQYEKFASNDIIVIGISKDSVSSHEKFSDKNDLPFILLSDEGLDIIKYFEAYGIKKMFNNTYYGVYRMTYILNENHEIVKTYSKATPKTNALDILKYFNIE